MRPLGTRFIAWLIEVLDQHQTILAMTPSCSVSQRVYFLLTGMLTDPEQYEQMPWDFVGESWQSIQHISDFRGKRLSDLPIDFTLSAKTFGKLIEI